MTDKASKSTATSADAIATGLVGNLGALSRAILSAANIPVPPLEACLSPLQRLSAGKNRGQRKTELEVRAEKAEIESALKSNLVHYNKLSMKSTGLLAKHSSSVSNILLFAKYIQEFEATQDLDMIEKYKAFYIQEKEALRDVMKSDREFSEFMHDLMASSNKNDAHKHFGILFHAENYCEPEFQYIADIANTVNLTKLSQKAPMPKEVQMAANLFGRDREYKTVPLASKLGHLVLPIDPTKDNTVYVVCPELKKYENNSGDILEDIRGAGGQVLFNQLQEEINNLPMPENWKANIKVVGDNLGGEVAKEYFSAIQKGLQGELQGLPEGVKKHGLNQAKKMAQKAGLGEEAKKLYQRVGSLDLGNIQTSPLSNPAFKANSPGYNKSLTKANIPQGLGAAGLVLNVAQQLGLDAVAKEAVKGVDQHLVKYHYYRVARPGLKFIAENALPTAGMVISGAALGSAVPGIGTGVGAAIGAGAAVALMTYKGYALYKERKQIQLEKEGRKRGMEMHSSYQDLDALTPSNPPMTFSGSGLKQQGAKLFQEHDKHMPKKVHEAEEPLQQVKHTPHQSKRK